MLIGDAHGAGLGVQTAAEAAQRVHAPAHMVAGFEDADLVPGLAQQVRGSQAGHAGTDDQHLARPCGARQALGEDPQVVLDHRVGGFVPEVVQK